MKKALVAEDEYISQRIIANFLQEFGFSVELASNGKEAMDVINSVDDLSIVLTDIKMPEMDGWDFIKNLRENNKYRNLPVIIITAASELDDITKLFSLGSVHYLTKPVDKEHLKKLLQLSGLS